MIHKYVKSNVRSKGYSQNRCQIICQYELNKIFCQLEKKNHNLVVVKLLQMNIAAHLDS